MSHYKHLTTQEREIILVKRVKGESIRIISNELKRSASTISRELKRNHNKRKRYSPEKATQDYHHRRLKCRRRKLLEDEIIRDKVQTLFLQQQWSPEQISQRLKHEDNPISISYTTIYRGIYSGLLEEKKLTASQRGVARKLRHRGKTRHKKGVVETRGKIVISNTIDVRPPEAAERKVIGHWELDTVLGTKSTGCVITLVDRCSRYFLVGKALWKSSQLVADRMCEMLNELPTNRLKTITSDRGKEFSKHSLVTDALNVPFYFADPHSPWQRPTNENTNGLLREYMPKKTDFTLFSESDVQEFAKKLNTRPRKCLGWKTPEEVFFKTVLHLT